MVVIYWCIKLDLTMSGLSGTLLLMNLKMKTSNTQGDQIDKLHIWKLHLKR